MYEIELIVPLPKEYPMESIYKQKKHRVAYLSMYYYVDKKQLEIDLFYVYNNRTKFKKDIGEHETFHTKGLGKYMLCKAIHYLLDTDWFNPNSTVTLLAFGEECFNRERYDAYTSDGCLEIIRQYDDSTTKLLELVMTHYEEELRDRLQIDSTSNIRNTELVNRVVNEMVNKKNKGDIKLKILLQNVVCTILTNQQLIEKNYRDIYGFTIVKNYGTKAEMVGTVYSILSACYGKEVTIDI
jgi:hypothetical protein